MSLKIYTDAQVTKKLGFELDVNYLFQNTGFIMDDYSKTVVREVEHGELLSKMKFKDRFGVTLYTSFLSTSSKALICLGNVKDKIINFSEVGKYVGEVACLNRSGYIYMHPSRLEFFFADKHDDEIDVEVNGLKFTRKYDFLEYAERF